MEIRAKERLTGAVILVALVVLVVPELLSGNHRTGASHASGGDEAPLRSVTIRLDEEPHGVATRSEPPAASVADSAPPAVPATARVEPAVAAPESPTGAAASGSTATQVVSASPPSAAAHPDSAWSVQLGSFASRENAERLVRELRHQGFTARIAAGEGHGRQWYRVRAGPARDVTAAQALARRLKAAGHAGSVVAAF